MGILLSALCPSAQGSRELGERLPRKLKEILLQGAWPMVEGLLQKGVEVGGAWK